ncbi:hypothetical protein IIA79_00100 [bacterium]|nr:hypothetical protein [bacterium]
MARIALTCLFALVIGACAVGQSPPPPLTGGTEARQQDSHPAAGAHPASPFHSQALPQSAAPMYSDAALDKTIAEIGAYPAQEGIDAALFAELKQALIKSVSAAAGGGISDPAYFDPIEWDLDLKYDQEAGLLSWNYANRGDYDLNGEVGVSDITPIGRHFGAVVGDAIGDDALEAWVDGDDNGVINIADVTPLGQYYLNYVEGYRILATETIDHTAADMGFEEVGRFLLAGAPTGYPPRFEFELPGAGERFIRLEEIPGAEPERSLLRYPLDLENPGGGNPVIRDFIDPSTGNTVKIIEGRVLVAFSVPLDDPRVETFIAAEQLVVINAWHVLNSIGAYLPEGQTVEDAVANWPLEYAEIIIAVEPDTIYKLL